MGALRLRRWSRVISVALLFAAVPGLPHLALDDRACLSAVESYERHDETQHAVVPGVPHQQDHCAICHWNRSLRAPRASDITWLGVVVPSSSVHGHTGPVHLAPALEYLPARAPPAPLL